MNGQFEPDDEYKRRQRSRNIVVGLLLVGFAVLLFAITIVRLKDAL
ncbi:hypothetical protein [Croceicoccus estronivorus]|nr:hypothetical protein [Croceicoccus estronivorus]